jgi:tetratricopeptide (TPR) repeat protein
MRARLLSLFTLATLATAAPLLAQELPESERIKWERQLAYVQSLIEAEPSLPQHYMRAAQAWAQLGQTDQVLRYTQEAVRLGGSPLAADILVADHLTTLGRSQEAMERYLRVLDSSPRQAHTLTRLWLILQTARGGNERLPNMDSAAARLNNAGYYLSDRPQPPDEGAARQRIALGNQRLNNNDIIGAVGAYKEAADLDPWNPDLYRGMGIAYARTGDFDRAVGAYHLYMALAPPDTPDIPKVRQIIMDFYQRGP